MRYLDIDRLRTLGIETRFVDDAITVYPQRHGEFVPGLSVVDALLNCGPDAVMRLLRS